MLSVISAEVAAQPTIQTRKPWMSQILALKLHLDTQHQMVVA
jgi:hypothetical protein